MTIKYEVYNQLTGLVEEASTFENAKILQTKIRADYISTIEGLFDISVLVQNEDGSWTQARADSEGNPVVSE